MNTHHAVHKLPDASLKISVEMQRAHLLAAAVRYVQDGQDGYWQDRLRTASDLSGLSKTVIELELKR